MTKVKINKIFVIIFVVLIGIVSTSQETKASRKLFSCSFYLEANIPMCMLAYLEYDDGCLPPLLCDPELVIKISSMLFNYDKEIIGNNIAINNNEVFKIIFDNALYVTSNDDAVVEIYELVSGKCVINNLSITKNAKTILNKIEENNKHYIILLKMFGRTYKQTFFVNGNQLFRGGYEYEK